MSNMENLRDGDKQLIAEGLKCNRKTVEFVLNGTRGKRETDLQLKIKEASRIRAKQNKEFVEFCNQIAFTAINPTN